MANSRPAAERAYVVWCPTMTSPRYKSLVYVVCATAVVLYIGVICHLFIGIVYSCPLPLTFAHSFLAVRIAHLRADGTCMIGFRLDGIIILVAFDLYVPFRISSMFSHLLDL